MVAVDPQKKADFQISIRIRNLLRFMRIRRVLLLWPRKTGAEALMPFS